MDDSALRARSDGEVEPGSSNAAADGWLEAAMGVWPAWLLAVGAGTVAVYFHLTEGIWTTAAEIFYAEIFALAALIALAYGAHEAHDRTTAF